MHKSILCAARTAFEDIIDKEFHAHDLSFLASSLRYLMKTYIKASICLSWCAFHGRLFQRATAQSLNADDLCSPRRFRGICTPPLTAMHRLAKYARDISRDEPTAFIKPFIMH